MYLDLTGNIDTMSSKRSSTISGGEWYKRLAYAIVNIALFKFVQHQE